MVNRQFQIVVADDDMDDQFFVAEAIKNLSLPHQITSVYDGVQLLEFLQHKGKFAQRESENPDLILLDINMPRMNGIAALSKIKRDEKLNKIPVYILSTTHQASFKSECMALGAADFITKPNNIGELKYILEGILAGKRPVC